MASLAAAPAKVVVGRVAAILAAVSEAREDIGVDEAQDVGAVLLVDDLVVVNA
jgi:hypothetical protein